MKHSGGPWTLSGMKENNARLERPVREFLQDIVSVPAQHARFMNMLSMLEHMGSRKIMISRMNKTLTEDILKHLAEEARHAYFFKRQAERVAGRPLDGFTDENTICRVPALMYFGRMDAGITKMLKTRQRLHQQKCHPEQSEAVPSGAEGSDDAAQDPRFYPLGHKRGEDKEEIDPYPWVSLIIELRACWLYAIYQDVLKETDLHISLKSLLAEEDMHLAEMFTLCDANEDRLKRLSAYETQLFDKLWMALCASFVNTRKSLLAA